VVLGLLATILFLTIEMGLVLDVRMALWAAAREGARRAAIEGGDTARTRQAVADLMELLPLAPAEYELIITPAYASYGTTVSVILEMEYRWRTPVGRMLLGERLHLRAEAQARSEKVRTGT